MQAISQIVSCIAEDLESGRKVAIILCDVTSAFDYVNHDLLLAKLDRYGVRGLVLSLIFQVGNSMYFSITSRSHHLTFCMVYLRVLCYFLCFLIYIMLLQITSQTFTC